MGILVGIDEAGFGPALGPLVVSGSVFRMADDQLDTCLWQMLRTSCTRRVDRKPRRLVVADSKQLFRGRSSLTLLERTALVALAASGINIDSFRSLLGALSPSVATDAESYRWYAGHDAALPISQDVGDVGPRINALRRDLASQGVSIRRPRCVPILEGEFNRLVAGTRNKSTVLMGAVMRVIHDVLQRERDQAFRICVDRLGGRVHYREVLMTSLPGWSLQILEESPTISAYRLTSDTRQCDIGFSVDGDKLCFPIALASVYSKYVRELFMFLFNRYWSGQSKDLKPTAGYYNDAVRWLRDAKPVIARLSVDRRQLVRSR